MLMVMTKGRAALDNKITKHLDGLWERQAAYHASLQRIVDARRAVTENKLLGDSDPSREAILLADLWERQAAYHASRERIADTQRAVTENKLLGDPSRYATLLADYQEAVNHLLDTGPRENRPATTGVPSIK
jgi:hypothetical protein